MSLATFGIRDQSLKKGLKEFFRKCGKKGEALISKASTRQSGRRLTYRHAGVRKRCVITHMLIAPKTAGAVVPPPGWSGKDLRSRFRAAEVGLWMEYYDIN